MDEVEYLNRLITEADAAEYLGHTVRALQNWRHRGQGPRFCRIGARGVRYRRFDLNEWAESRLVHSTSEAFTKFGV